MKEQRLGHGISIQGFDSMEEMLAYQAEQEAVAISESLDEQWRITWGSYVFRQIEGLSIWGHIMTPAEILGEHPDEEAIAELEQLQDAHARGYRYGKYYSTVEPAGEYGSAHVVSLWPIGQQAFERARLVGWELWEELAISLMAEMREARDNQKGTEDERPDE